MTTLLKTLTLSFGDADVSCQLSQAQLEPTYAETTVQTFCGAVTDQAESWVLNLTGFQDWGDAAGVCDLLWNATDAGTDVDFELAVGPDTFSGSVAPKRTVVGGTAGGAFDYSVKLNVQGNVTKAATPAGP
jgi:hypothetical protein